MMENDKEYDFKLHGEAFWVMDVVMAITTEAVLFDGDSIFEPAGERTITHQTGLIIDGHMKS